MPTLNEFTFLSCNGKTDIHVRCFQPDAPAWGVVQIAHGIAEHAERYDDFADFLAENGYVVYINDHLGHGKSVGGDIELGFAGENCGWELMVGDMKKLHDIAAEENPGLPYFMLGHSMGSFLLRTYIIHYRDGLAGVVLSGTGQQPLAMVEAGKLLANFEIEKHGASYRSDRLNDLAFGKYNDGIVPNRTVSDWISSDEAQVDKYIADPLCGYVPSAALLRDMMGGISFISRQRNISRMNKNLHVYFMSGDRDPVGEFGKGVMRAYKGFLRAGMTDVTLRLYHGGRHEMLSETNRSEVFADVLDWLDKERRK